LNNSNANKKIHIGREVTRGLGAGMDPEMAQKRPRNQKMKSKKNYPALTWFLSPVVWGRYWFGRFADCCRDCPGDGRFDSGGRDEAICF
jgi:hypothetical protein